MKKLLLIKDSVEFWKVFAEERRKRRTKLRKLSFEEKVEIVEKMKTLSPLKVYSKSK